MPEIKPTILANVSRALSTNNETPVERKQSNLLTSVNSNLRMLVKQGRQNFRLQRDKTQTKLLTSVRNVLERIKKNTKPEGKKMGILKFLLFMFAGILLRTVKGIWNAVKFLGRGVKTLGRTLKNWAKSLVLGFRRSRVGKFLSNLGKRFGMFGKILRESRIVQSFQNLGKGFKTFSQSISKLGVVGGKGFNSFFKLVNQIFMGFGKLVKALRPLLGFLRPVMGVLGKIALPIFALITLFDALRGLSKASEWFGKKEGELLTLGERVSAVIGSVISGLTFGLIGSGEQMAKGLHKVFTKPIEFFKDDFPRIMGKIGKKLIGGVKKIGKFFVGSIVGLFTFISSIDWVGIIKSTRDMFIKGITKVSEVFVKGISMVITKIIDIFKNTDWATLGKTLFTIFATVGTSIFKVLWTVVTTVPKVIWSVLKLLPDLILNVFKAQFNIFFGVVSGIGEFLKMGLENILIGIGNVLDSIKSVFSVESLSKMGDVVTSITDWGKGLITSIFDGIKNIFKSEDGVEDQGLLSKTMDALSGLKDKVIVGLKKFVLGIVNGVGTILDTLKQGAGKVVQFVKDLLFGEKKGDEIKEGTRVLPSKFEMEDKTKPGQIGISETMTETEKTVTFMNFMVNEFADTMAKKIAEATKNGGDVSSVKVPLIKLT